MSGHFPFFPYRLLYNPRSQFYPGKTGLIRVNPAKEITSGGAFATLNGQGGFNGGEDRLAAWPLDSKSGCVVGALRFGQEAQNNRLEAGATRAKSRLGYRGIGEWPTQLMNSGESRLIKANPTLR